MCGVANALSGAELLLGLTSKKSDTSTPTVTAPAVVDSGQQQVQAQEDQRKKLALAQGYNSTISAGNSQSTGQVGTKSLLGE